MRNRPPRGGSRSRCNPEENEMHHLCRGLLFAALAVTLPAAPAAAQGTYVSHSETASLAKLEKAFADVAKKASPGVVAITVGMATAPPQLPATSSKLNAAVLDQLTAGGARTVGTGFCVDSRGYIVTNQHVVEGARQIYVTTDDGRIIPAMVVATDPRGDLAVIKVPMRMQSVSFAPAVAERGQWAVAVGNPIGLGGNGGMSVSAGLISATGRSLPRLSRQEGRHYANLLQTTAELNPGNSGGPLLDLHGRVIGVVTAVVLPQAQTHGIGFAMPADADMQARVARMILGDAPTYGYLGVAGRAASSTDGMLVTRVGPGTPADGHLKAGDVILALGDRPVRDEETFVKHVGASPVSEPVALHVRRGGQRLAVVVQLDQRPETTGVDTERQRLVFGGITFGNSETPGGGCLVLAVDPQSPLARAYPLGSIIHHVGKRSTPNLVTLHEALDAQ